MVRPRARGAEVGVHHAETEPGGGRLRTSGHRGMAAVYNVVKLDAMAIQRDQVAVATVALSVLGTLAVTTAGVFEHRLPGWSDWFPFVIAVSLVQGPGGFGLLFGLLMVDEAETGVREALAVSPVRPTLLITIRTIVPTVWMCVWPPVSIWLMNSTWQAINLHPGEWLAVVGPLALLTPALALLIPTIAADKVGALAVFKALSFVMLAPLALYFIRETAWYRPFFLASPSGWSIEAYRAFLAEDSSYGPALGDRWTSGYLWACGGAAYALVLLAISVHFFRRNVYRSYG
jgi:hypothetical protein